MRTPFNNVQFARGIFDGEVRAEVSSYPLILPGEPTHSGGILEALFRDTAVTPQVSMIVSHR